ncbi:MAG: hypothetical protein SGILL_000851 [Bacillariaceae sp.]
MTIGNDERQSDIPRFTSMRVFSRRASVTPAQETSCQSLVLEVLTSESSRLRSPALMTKVAQSFENASALHIAGNEKEAHVLLRSLRDPNFIEQGIFSSAAVFFAAEKGRQQNQRQRRREQDRIVELTNRKSKIKCNMAHINDERMKFGESLALAISQQDAAKIAMEKHRQVVEKLENGNMKYSFALGEGGNGANAVIPFMGLDKLIDGEQEVYEKEKFLEEDLHRKESTVSNIQNELIELHHTIRSLQKTFELVETSIRDTRLTLFELQRSVKDADAFVMDSARMLYRELYSGRGSVDSANINAAPTSSFVRKFSLRPNWAYS